MYASLISLCFSLIAYYYWFYMYIICFQLLIDPILGFWESFKVGLKGMQCNCFDKFSYYGLVKGCSVTSCETTISFISSNSKTVWESDLLGMGPQYESLSNLRRTLKFFQTVDTTPMRSTKQILYK